MLCIKKILTRVTRQLIFASILTFNPKIFHRRGGGDNRQVGIVSCQYTFFPFTCIHYPPHHRMKMKNPYPETRNTKYTVQWLGGQVVMSKFKLQTFKDRSKYGKITLQQLRRSWSGGSKKWMYKHCGISFLTF